MLLSLFDLGPDGLTPLLLELLASFSDSRGNELRGLDFLLQQQGEDLVYDRGVVFSQRFRENTKVRCAAFRVQWGAGNQLRGVISW